MIKANDLYLKLKEIEDRIRHSENPDGSCAFEADKVFIFLETALSFLPDPKDTR